MNYGVRHKKIGKGVEFNAGHWGTSISTNKILGLSLIQNYIALRVSMALMLPFV